MAAFSILVTEGRMRGHINEQQLSHSDANLVTQTRNITSWRILGLLHFCSEILRFSLRSANLIGNRYSTSCSNIYINSCNSRFAPLAMSEEEERQERQERQIRDSRLFGRISSLDKGKRGYWLPCDLLQGRRGPSGGFRTAGMLQPRAKHSIEWAYFRLRIGLQKYSFPNVFNNRRHVRHSLLIFNQKLVIAKLP